MRTRSAFIFTASCAVVCVCCYFSIYFFSVYICLCVVRSVQTTAAIASRGIPNGGKRNKKTVQRGKNYEIEGPMRTIFSCRTLLKYRPQFIEKWFIVLACRKRCSGVGGTYGLSHSLVCITCIAGEMMAVHLVPHLRTRCFMKLSRFHSFLHSECCVSSIEMTHFKNTQRRMVTIAVVDMCYHKEFIRNSPRK